jgi:hypothetical protein
VRGRRPAVPVIVGLALALLAILTLLGVFAAGEASVNWKRARIGLPVAAGVAFAIGWAGTLFATWLIADRRRVAIFALLLFIAMGLCPPWVHTVSPEGAATTTRPAGYRLLFDPPEPEWPGVRIDISRLAIQWAVLTAFAAVAFVSTYGKARGNGT